MPLTRQIKENPNSFYTWIINKKGEVRANQDFKKKKEFMPTTKLALCISIHQGGGQGRNSKIGVEYIDMLGHFEIKKAMVYVP